MKLESKQRTKPPTMDVPPPVAPEVSKKKKSSKKKKNKNKGKNKNDDDANNSSAPAQFTDLKSPTTDANSQYPDADIDAVSNGSFESSSSRPRRRARGGRKKKSQLQIVSEDEQNVARDGHGQSDGREQGRLQKEQLRDAERPLNGQADGASTSSATVRDEYQEDSQVRADHENARPMANGAGEPERARPKKSDTGVKAFNIRKANPDGGRPIGPRVQMSGAGGQSSAGEQSQQSQGGATTTQADSGETTQSGHGNEEKNVSIKVDLNLEVEILLKAKIKGEVMLTFL